MAQGGDERTPERTFTRKRMLTNVAITPLDLIRRPLKRTKAPELFLVMAERPLKFSLSLPSQPGTTISSSDVLELCREQLSPNRTTLIEAALTKHQGLFRVIKVGVYFYSFQNQIQCSLVKEEHVSKVALSDPDKTWSTKVPKEVNEAVYSFFYKGEEAAKVAVLRDRFLDMPTDTAKEELEVAQEEAESRTDSDAEFVNENERTTALYEKLKPKLDATGFCSSTLATTHTFGFNKSCCYLSGGADIVFYNPQGILIMDVQESSLDDSTEEGELSGVSASESKLKLQFADIHQVIGEGIIFTSRYLMRMIADAKVDPKDVCTVKAYLIWMVVSSTIRFYSLKADFDTSRFILVPKGTLHYDSYQPKRFGQYLTFLLRKLERRSETP